ncbi:MAG: hypothetical protein JO071_17110 [Deltaproteobacteria bacterium]|nr:hypothetical protein [Deltaproteobacteria bacterium]
MLPIGNYFYQIRHHGELVAFEDSRFDTALIVASRRSADGLSRHQVEAALDPEHRVCRVTLSYSSSLFTRKASYEAVEDNLCGRVSGLAGRNEIVVKLGRFREVDAAGFLIFRALIVGHVRLRGDERWTGRVAVIDPNTLAAASVKQNCARRNSSERSWIYEPRMGDTEHIELDEAGRIVRRRDNRGVTAELMTTDTYC